MAVHFEGRLCKILLPGPHQKLIAEILQVEGLYTVLATHPTHHAHLAGTKISLHQLHKVLGHVSQKAVHHAMSKGLVQGLELDSSSMEEFCDTCIKAKSARVPFPKESTRRAKTYGEIVHTDFWGPAQTESIAGSWYYMSFTNDYSRETVITFLKSKSEALNVLYY
jgi:hypothetical protein